MKVTLISHTPNPEKTIAAAAKLCYSGAELDNILDGISEEQATYFVEMLSEIGHESPIEHASFTFGIEGVSRSLSHQLVRHRIASYSQQSQRYVSEGGFQYVTPPEIANNERAHKEFIKAMEQSQIFYDNIASTLKEQYKAEYLQQGMEEKRANITAEKRAIEDARFVLPNACDTKLIATFNARSLQNFFHHRCCNRAQWEIKELADEMLKLVFEVAPSLFKNAGPKCTHGPCPEGNKSCGKRPEVIKNYEALKGNI